MKVRPASQRRAADVTPEDSTAMDERGRDGAPVGRTWAWILLFGALADGAGHGLFLYVRTARPGWIPSFGRLLDTAGISGTLVIGWFMASLPLALLALAWRRALLRQRWLGAAALLVTLAAAGAFAFYARWMTTVAA
jgi:hypothetical protein